MSLQFIEGGAGTGKTTTVIERLGQHLAASPLGDHQRVLALTRMHGSRRRVRERLLGVAGLNRRFEAATIDSFSWRIVRRWRSLARVLAGPAALAPTEYDATCELAGRLLEESCVQKWVASSFPIVVVDELQDSKAGQLRVLKGLCVGCECIAAGDPFQDLDCEDTCASVEWARKHGTLTLLETTHRTNNAGLLEAATAFRTAQPVVAAGGFSLKGVQAAPLGAWEVASRIAKWKTLGTVAVITPVSAARSAFVRQIVERVNSEPPLGKKWKIGPFKLPWEMAQEEQIDRTCRDLGLPDEDAQLIRADALKLGGEGRIGKVREWLSRQRRLLGRQEFSAAEVRAVVKEAVHHGRLFSRHDERRLVAMTIHQAKNREFDRVIVLWPYEVSGNEERQRRLAYNAITRARHEALVVVQNEARVSQSPFVPGVSASYLPPKGKKRELRGGPRVQRPESE
jgi:superfamily I DNA/RNA helicase